MKSLPSRFVATLALFGYAVMAFAQQPQFADPIWAASSDAALSKHVKVIRNSQPTNYLLYSLDLADLKKMLLNAPLRGPGATAPVIVKFPNSAGVLEQYEVYETPIMEPALAAKYPMIKTYTAQGVQDPTAYMKLSITQYGLHTFTLSGKRATTYIDPFTEDTKYYIVYDRTVITSNPTSYQCLMGMPSTPTSLNKSVSGGLQGKSANDQIHRTFRLALSCTAEYGNYFANTGTELADIQAAMAVTMNRVNGVYEIDLAVDMVLVANNDQIIYWGNTGADPWSGEWNSTTQTEIDSKIGNANYDIGHNY